MGVGNAFPPCNVRSYFSAHAAVSWIKVIIANIEPLMKSWMCLRAE
jgi:hypothetical protein